MDGDRSLFADACPQTEARLREAASSRGCAPSQIADDSLRLYLDLPDMVHDALRDIDAFGTSEDRRLLMRAVARSVASTRYEVVLRHAAKTGRIDNEERLQTDEDIVAEAVRVTAIRV